MKFLYVIIIFAALSACDRDTDRVGAEDESEAPLQSPSGQGQAQSSNLPRARAYGQDKDHRSEAMKELLASSAPQWLTLGSALQPEQVEAPPDPKEIRPKFLVPKGATKEVVIQGEAIKLPFPASEVTWVAVSPNSSRVILERGDLVEVWSVKSDGSLVDADSLVPRLNFESDRRWMLTRWHWISESELVAALNRPTADGDIIAEAKLYYYDLNTKNLREIGLPNGFMNQNDPYLEILGSAGRQIHVHTLTGDAWFQIPKST